MDQCRLDFCTSIALDHIDLCAAHYAQQRGGKDLTPIGSNWKREQRLCQEENCQNISQAKNWCRAHYLQQYHDQEFREVTQHEHLKCKHDECDHIATTRGFCLVHSKATHNRPQCKFDTCSLKSDSRGYCKTHYAQLLRGEEPHDIRPWGKYQKGTIVCGVASCSKSARSNGYCSVHVSKVSKYNMTPEQADYWFGIKKCQACGGTKRLTVDHDHSCCNGRTSCGKCIRGVLCSNCNVALGNAHDNITALEGLIAYLEATKR